MFDSWLKPKDSKLNLKYSKPIIHAVLGTPINAPPSTNEEEIYFACGCFWGAEKAFWKLPGVVTTSVGYAGGNTEYPNYKEVCSGNTNHAEVVRVEFDPKIISYEKILNFFFEIHDPTTLNSQGPDFGTQYRSEIFFLDNNQKNIAEKTLKKINNKFSGKIVTKISLIKNYCPAEEYHQRYLEKR